MNIAMCAAFLEADVWERHLKNVVAPYTVEVTEFNNVQVLLSALELKTFAILVVIFNGAAGLDAVRRIREKQPETPLLWISDEDFRLFGYRYHVTYFLCKPVSDVELRTAINNCIES